MGTGSASLDGIGARIMRQAALLAQHTEVPGQLTRRFLTPVQRAAAETLMGWMRDAGMTARIDAIGNVVGRYEGERPDAPALMLGSHFDSVRNGGRYDGDLGVIAPIACVDALHRDGHRLAHAVEVVAFADEEGVRFQATLLGSKAVAGTFDAALLDTRDADGVTMADALVAYGLDPARVGEAARRRDEVLAYCELHIEQGPVLLTEGLPVGVVTSIVGFNRYRSARPASPGTPAPCRWICAATRPPPPPRSCSPSSVAAARPQALVGTVGQLCVPQGAINVIPGACELVARRAQRRRRHPRGGGRRHPGARSKRSARAAASRSRSRRTRRHRSCRCAPWLMDQLDAAVGARRHPGPAAAVGRRPRRDGDRPARRRRHAVRALRQRRHQPSPRRDDDRGRRRRLRTDPPSTSSCISPLGPRAGRHPRSPGPP